MQIYEVLNYFDRSRYFVSATNEEEMLEIVDKEFLRKLEAIENEYVYEDGEKEYDHLRNDRNNRMDEIAYTFLIEDATKSGIHQHNLEGDLNKFYF